MRVNFSKTCDWVLNSHAIHRLLTSCWCRSTWAEIELLKFQSFQVQANEIVCFASQKEASKNVESTTTLIESPCKVISVHFKSWSGAPGQRLSIKDINRLRQSILSLGFGAIKPEEWAWILPGSTKVVNLAFPTHSTVVRVRKVIHIFTLMCHVLPFGGTLNCFGQIDAP